MYCIIMNNVDKYFAMIYATKIGIVTGGFDPLHSGHIDYIKEAASKVDILYIGVNSDSWLVRKKGKEFMSFEERQYVISNLNLPCEFHAIGFLDGDNTAKDIIYKVAAKHKNSSIWFMNGGDRTKLNVPEQDIKSLPNGNTLSFIFNIGGSNKKNSSSLILDEWKTQKTLRDWGYWRVLDDKNTVKVKELVIEPGKTLSDQRHFHRSEHWYVLSGRLNIDLEFANGDKQLQVLNNHTTFVINQGTWHRPYNIDDEPVHIIEIQYGEKCVEEDIERRT